MLSKEDNETLSRVGKGHADGDDDASLLASDRDLGGVA
jgi:hypothetical protein